MTTEYRQEGATGQENRESDSKALRVGRVEGVGTRGFPKRGNDGTYLFKNERMNKEKRKESVERNCDEEKIKTNCVD